MEPWIEEELRGMEFRPRPPRRRAMVGLALPIMAGTAVGICAPISPAWFWAAGALLLLPLFVWVRQRWSVWPLMLAAFFLMAAHARQATGNRGATSLAAQMVRPMEYVQFAAVALEDATPQAPQPGRAAGATFAAQVEGLNRDGAWRRVDDRIRVVVRGAMPGGRRLPRYGERWRLRGLVRPAVPRRSGLFTLPQNQAVVDSDRLYFLDAGQGNPLVAWCMERRRACREILGRGLEDFPEERGVLQALLLGYRDDLPKTLRQDFVSTGTVHIFAISGAHVGMMAFLSIQLLRALGIPMARWFFFLAPMLAVYTITTGAATSAIRACAMASMMLAAPVLKRRPDAISGLAAAAIGILACSPAQLGDLGFLLSFTAVAGLLALQPLFDAGAVRLFRRDDWQLPGEELPQGRRARETGLYVARFGLVSVSAWIGTSPLTAFFFNLFSPVALGMNLLVIPAAFCILFSGVMSLLCAPFSGWVSETFNFAAYVFAALLARCIGWAADWQGGHGFVRTPPAAGVIAWYAILAATAVMARRVRGALAAGLALLAALAVGWGAWEANRCRVSVLDVGEGNAVLVQAKSARILVDAGPESCERETLRLLRAEGVNRLDALILTHADAQHIGAAPGLLSALPIRELWIPAVVWPSPRLKDVLRQAEALGIPIRRLRAGDAGDWPGDVFWEIFWPPEKLEMACADDASLAMRVARGGVSVLLAGDTGPAQEKAMRASGTSLAASVLVVARHGDAAATSAAWLDEVRPHEAIISSGAHADERHPDAALMERLMARKIRLWQTDRQGSIHVELAKDPASWPDRSYRMGAVIR